MLDRIATEGGRLGSLSATAGAQRKRRRHPRGQPRGKVTHVVLSEAEFEAQKSRILGS